MPVKFKGISTVDGRTVEVSSEDLSESGEPEGSSSYKFLSLVFKYNYSNTLSTPPNSSQVRANNTNLANMTALWVHRVDNANVDNKFFLMNVKAGKRLYVQDIDNADSHAIFVLTADPIDKGSYVEFPVTCESASGTALAGTAILFGI